MKSNNKKQNISYYVGCGIAWGICIGTLFGIVLQDHLSQCFFLGIAFGACVGGIYGKKSISNNHCVYI